MSLSNQQEIIANQEIEKYIERKKKLYNNLLLFIESSDDSEKCFHNIIDIINKQKLKENRENFEHFIRLIASIANNHSNTESFFNKIYQIIQHFVKEIKQTLSNIEIFHIFQNNKKIILFLFEKEIITLDSDIADEIINKTEFNDIHYCHFFYPELKKFYGEDKTKDIEKELLLYDSNVFDLYEKNRHEGENEAYICSLIRDDYVEDFIAYVNRKNLPLNSEVNLSIFETHSFLNENHPTLIEYAAFFGSFQIFQYLVMNKVPLESSLWLYVIHSKNGEMIHLLESYKVCPHKNQYIGCFTESIKCHHNDIAEYIKITYLPSNDYDDEITNNDEILYTVMHYHNYSYFQSNFETRNEFYFLCSENYNTLVDLFINKKEENIKYMIGKNVFIFFSFYALTLRKAADEDLVEIVYYLLIGKDKIDEKMFLKSSITKIAIPSCITSIGSRAFNGCLSLEYVVIPSSVKLIESYAFYGCHSLKQVTIPSLLTTIKKGAFESCKSLKTLTIPSSVTIIEEEIFAYCWSLKHANILSFLPEISINLFDECRSLKQIIIPSSVVKINNCAFYNCTSLVHVMIPLSVTTIGVQAFFGCSSLVQIEIPPSVIIIEKQAFKRCTSLVQIEIPSSVTKIEKQVFEGCSALKEASIFSKTEITNDSFPSQTIINKK